jgi:hypothetical protein
VEKTRGKVEGKEGEEGSGQGDGVRTARGLGRGLSLGG